MVELILFGSLAVMIFINIPIAIGLGLASIATLIYVGSPLGVVKLQCKNLHYLQYRYLF